MKTYTFYKIKGLNKIHLKTFFDISDNRKCEISYIKHDTKESIPAYVNELYLLVPKNFPKDKIWKLFVNRPLFESYSNQDRIKFSSSINDITPDFEINQYVTKEVDILFGFIFPEKYNKYDIYRYEYFKDRSPVKEKFYFNKNKDEILILNRYVSQENKTLMKINN